MQSKNELVLRGASEATAMSKIWKGVPPASRSLCQGSGEDCLCWGACKACPPPRSVV